MEHDENPINAKAPREGGRLEAVRWRIEDTAWGLRRYWLWPLQDWFVGQDRSTRVAFAGGGAVVVGLVAVLALSLAGGSGGSGAEAKPTVIVEAAATTATKPAPAPKHEEAAATLHGAAPVFEAQPSHVNASAAEKQATAGEAGPKATEETTSSSSTAATAKISSTSSDSASGSGGETAVEPEAIPGRPAGPKAIAVARRFSQAFVVYETGGEESGVKRAFATTTTPALAKALLRRPPRLPAHVEVPKAKVVNVVPGPSREGVYTLSVSLLRVGVTSELRLEMEKLKDEGWRVTNVLG